MLAYIFPGQGAQEKGMGKDLFPQFSQLLEQANDFLGYSIQTLCLEDPDNLLHKTSHTQIAIYVVNALHYFARQQSIATQADFVAGHSLGEYNALLAANVFDFMTGLQLVQRRAQLMAQAQHGGMAAIVGLTHDELFSALQQHGLSEITIANHNSFTQFVISGKTAAIANASTIFQNDNKANFIPLKVSGAFHSPLMQDAKNQFAKFLENFQLQIPTLPVLANINAKPYHPAILKTNLSNQIDQPVRWVQTMQYLQEYDNVQIEEIGHGKILTNLLRRIKAGT